MAWVGRVFGFERAGLLNGAVVRAGDALSAIKMAGGGDLLGFWGEDCLIFPGRGWRLARHGRATGLRDVGARSSEIGTIFARRRDADGATSQARNGLVSPRRRQGKRFLTPFPCPVGPESPDMGFRRLIVRQPTG
jgi:hypothetical protein